MNVRSIDLAQGKCSTTFVFLTLNVFHFGSYEFTFIIPSCKEGTFRLYLKKGLGNNNIARVEKCVMVVFHILTMRLAHSR